MAKHPPRKPPFSLRLTFEERAQLERKAGDLSLGSYVKSALFADAPGLNLGGGVRRVGPEKALLAQILAKLGDSDLAGSMRRLAEAADLCTLLVDDLLKRRLHDACDDVALVRNLLMQALGKRSGLPAPQPKTLSERFNLHAGASRPTSTPELSN